MSQKSQRIIADDAYLRLCLFQSARHLAYLRLYLLQNAVVPLYLSGSNLISGIWPIEAVVLINLTIGAIVCCGNIHKIRKHFCVDCDDFCAVHHALSPSGIGQRLVMRATARSVTRLVFLYRELDCVTSTTISQNFKDWSFGIFLPSYGRFLLRFQRPLFSGSMTTLHACQWRLRQAQQNCKYAAELIRTHRGYWRFHFEEILANHIL